MPEISVRPAPERLKKIFKTWTFWANTLRLVHVSLLIIASVSSILASSGVGKLENSSTNWCAILAAVSIGVLSALELGKMSNDYRNAWRSLNVAILRYECVESFREEDLIKAYADAEKLVGDVKAMPNAH